MTDSSPAIHVDRLVVERGGRTVLHGLDFSIRSGRITGLLGPSGCGKTTLMRAIVGVQIVESGGVRVLGQPAGSPAVRARVGYVTQTPAVYLDLSAQENLRYFAGVLGAPAARVAETLEMVQLEEDADRPVRNLVTSITMLRERTGGTLERLMSMPVGKIDLLAGCGIAFAAVAAVQACVTAAVAFLALGLEVAGSPAAVVALAIGNAVLGMALGLFVSAFARSEFQAVQFMPALCCRSCCCAACSWRASRWPGSWRRSRGRCR